MVFKDFLKKKQWRVDIKTNVRKYKDHIVIQLIVPGRHSDDFEVKFDHQNTELVIEARAIEKGNRKNYLRREFYLSGFSKVIYFGFDCQDNAISTKYLNGILYIRVDVGEQIKNF